MNSAQLVQNCSKFLEQRHIQVQPDWLEACIAWVQVEIKVTAAKEFASEVYEQWLQSDISDASRPSIPTLLPRAGVHMINCNFIVQLNSFMDIGRSAYSQFMKINGKLKRDVTTKSKNQQRKKLENHQLTIKSIQRNTVLECYI